MLTLREVLNFIEVKNEVQTEQQQISWEQTRWLGTLILQPHLKKGVSVKPTDLIKFPWDSKQIEISEEEKEKRKAKREKLFEQWDSQMKRKTNG